MLFNPWRRELRLVDQVDTTNCPRIPRLLCHCPGNSSLKNTLHLRILLWRLRVCSLATHLSRRPRRVEQSPPIRFPISSTQISTCHSMSILFDHDCVSRLVTESLCAIRLTESRAYEHQGKVSIPIHNFCDLHLLKFTRRMQSRVRSTQGSWTCFLLPVIYHNDHWPWVRTASIVKEDLQAIVADRQTN